MDTTYQHYCKPQNIILAYFRQIACRVSLMCVPVVFCHTKQWHGLSSEQLQPGYCLSHCLLQSDAVRQMRYNGAVATLSVQFSFTAVI